MPSTYLSNVPGIGTVTWTDEQLARHAHAVELTHLPNGPSHTIRHRFLIPYRVRLRRRCVTCLRVWPCVHIEWVRQYRTHLGVTWAWWTR